MGKMKELYIEMLEEGIDGMNEQEVNEWLIIKGEELMSEKKVVKKESKRTTYYAKDSREAVLDRVHRQRAIKAGVVWEKIDFKEIFSSQVNCGICSKPMNFTTGNSDPDYVTVDHIVAFANGGTHTEDNIQLVHRKCNASKGAK